tara:strand:- start:2502 stop:2720 length:219 start_codon:yes stop_codon:yes gene_type:complete
MTHVFMLILIIGGNQQGGQKMYFSSINTCNWYAAKLTKRYANHGGIVPEEHKVLAYCKPTFVDRDSILVYDY